MLAPFPSFSAGAVYETIPPVNTGNEKKKKKVSV
jgi:hypothetical protein